MRVSFVLNEAVRSGTAPSRYIGASKAPLERDLYPGRPRREVLASRGVVVLTLYSPLRPLSHKVHPRDGAQDIWRGFTNYTLPLERLYQLCASFGEALSIMRFLWGFGEALSSMRFLWRGFIYA
jgi:hypothetical protein